MKTIFTNSSVIKKIGLVPFRYRQNVFNLEVPIGTKLSLKDFLKFYSGNYLKGRKIGLLEFNKLRYRIRNTNLTKLAEENLQEPIDIIEKDITEDFFKTCGITEENFPYGKEEFTKNFQEYLDKHEEIGSLTKRVLVFNSTDINNSRRCFEHNDPFLFQFLFTKLLSNIVDNYGRTKGEKRYRLRIHNSLDLSILESEKAFSQLKGKLYEKKPTINEETRVQDVTFKNKQVKAIVKTTTMQNRNSKPDETYTSWVNNNLISLRSDVESACRGLSGFFYKDSFIPIFLDNSRSDKEKGLFTNRIHSVFNRLRDFGKVKTNHKVQFAIITSMKSYRLVYYIRTSDEADLEGPENFGISKVYELNLNTNGGITDENIRQFTSLIKSVTAEIKDGEKLYRAISGLPAPEEKKEEKIGKMKERRINKYKKRVKHRALKEEARALKEAKALEEKAKNLTQQDLSTSQQQESIEKEKETQKL